MFSVTVRDHMMIAHSLEGKVFGPAQRMHGATYVVDVEFRRQELDDDGIVIDIGLATDWLAKVLQPMKYNNLDTLPEFEGVNTTTEVLAKTVFDRLAAQLRESPAVPTGAGGVVGMKVTLTETPSAWAAYEAALG
jgi:6-pyruvoyl-tetrahydropterin synthase